MRIPLIYLHNPQTEKRHQVYSGPNAVSPHNLLPTILLPILLDPVRHEVRKYLLSVRFHLTGVIGLTYKSQCSENPGLDKVDEDQVNGFWIAVFGHR